MKSLGLSKPNWLIKLAVAAAASVLLIAFNHWLSLNYLSRSLAQQLRETLPNKIIEAGINESFHDSLNDYLVKRLNHDFAQLHVNSAFSAVQQCQAQVLRIHNKTYADSANTARIISLHWPINDHIQELKLGLACQWQWPKLIASQLFLSLLGLLMWTAVAPPLSPRRKQLLRALTEQGVNRRQAEQLSSTADDYSPRQEQALTLFLRSNYPYPSHYLAALNTPLPARWRGWNLHYDSAPRTSPTPSPSPNPQQSLASAPPPAPSSFMAMRLRCRLHHLCTTSGMPTADTKTQSMAGLPTPRPIAPIAVPIKKSLP
jgi:hypothetical protein